MKENEDKKNEDNLYGYMGFSVLDVNKVRHRGDIVLCRLSNNGEKTADSRRRLIGKTRPCVIVSDYRWNKYNYPYIMIAPIGTEKQDYQDLDRAIHINARERESKIIINQIRMIDACKDIISWIGTILDDKVLHQLEVECIKAFLSDKTIDMISLATAIFGTKEVFSDEKTNIMIGLLNIQMVEPNQIHISIEQW